MIDLPRVHHELETYSLSLSDEASYYWQRHQPRYDYIAHAITRLTRRQSIKRVLDIGMGFQTLLVRKLLAAASIESAGMAEDPRFRPEGNFRFHSLDLNDVSLPGEPCPSLGGDYDLIIFMEVLEHLFTPPELVLGYLASRLSPDGTLIVTTPNAAWLKNRIKMVFGKNPFEVLRRDRRDMGHIREYTRTELEAALKAAGLAVEEFTRRGLYNFRGAKDRFYSSLADLIHPSLSRNLVAICKRTNQARTATAHHPPFRDNDALAPRSAADA